MADQMNFTLVVNDVEHNIKCSDIKPQPTIATVTAKVGNVATLSGVDLVRGVKFEIQVEDTDDTTFHIGQQFEIKLP